MRSLILNTCARYLLPLLLVFSVFLLIRGHNAPGGGFVGGLVASTAITLYAIAYGVERARRVAVANPITLISLGLSLALASGLIGLLAGDPFLTGQWEDNPVPVIGKLGTPLLFDTGVFVLVLGIVLTIIFALAEE